MESPFVGGFRMGSSSDWTRHLLSSPLMGDPARPSKLTAAYTDCCFERIWKRKNAVEERVDASTTGRVIPDEESLAIGEGKHFSQLAILFLDICGFSGMKNWTTDEQKNVLKSLNMFMGEMLWVVRDYGGHFEKNTGDGLMAYFGEGAASVADAVKPAVEAAVTMHYINDSFMGFMMGKLGLPPIKFRVGIDVGPITIGRVAIHGGNHGSAVAIGTTANLACKLMRLIPDGGICIGEKTYDDLPNGWKQTCSAATESTGVVYIQDNRAYPAFTLDYRAPYVSGGGS